MNNGFIRFITSDTRFAFAYIALFMLVIFMAFFKQGGSPWEEIAWSMLSILGIIIFITGVTSFIEALESKKWPQCSATIVKSYITSSSTSDNGRVYTPNVIYGYTFQNESYEGCQIDFSSLSASKKWAQDVIDKIERKGKFLKVSVNPQQPSISVIYPGVKFVHFLRLIIGPAMIAAGVVFGFGLVEIT